MAQPPAKLFPKAKPKEQAATQTLFRKRQRQTGVVWSDVDWPRWLCLLQVCLRENIGIGIYPASGGRGVCLKLYTGKKVPDTEYASTAEEFDELVLGVLESLGEVIEDEGEADVAD